MYAATAEPELQYAWREPGGHREIREAEQDDDHGEERSDVGNHGRTWQLPSFCTKFPRFRHSQLS